MITIITGGKVYKGKIKEDEQGYSVSVFLESEKMPLFGTRFGLMASFEKDMMAWIKTKCRQHSSGEIESIKIF